VCYQETMLHDLSVASIRSIYPNRSYLWDWVPSHGRAGGIITSINLDRFDAGGRHQGFLFYSLIFGISCWK
jgi:hypothetical protein